jgi:hypothetical protein
MSYKSGLFALYSTCDPALRSTNSRSWGSSAATLQDAEFLRSWLVYDSEIQTGRTRGRINWNLLLGLALAATVSTSFWTGLGLVIARFWK